MKRQHNIPALRGRIDILVFKKYRHGTEATRVPDMSRAGCSEKQHFQHVIARVKKALRDPRQKAFFEKMPGNSSAWNKAIRFFYEFGRTGDQMMAAHQQTFGGK